MFVGKAKSQPWNGGPERGFTKAGSCLTCKHYTRLENLARENAPAYFKNS